MVIAGLVMILMPFLDDTAPQSIRILVPIIGLAVLFLAYSTKSLDIVLTDEHLRFGFGFMKSKVNLLDIKELIVQDFKFRNFGGYGVRISRMNKEKVIGYIPKGGTGLYIKTNKKNYFIISNRTNELQTLINDRIRILKNM